MRGEVCLQQAEFFLPPLLLIIILTLLSYILCAPSSVQGLAVVWPVYLGVDLLAFKEQLFCLFHISLIFI